MTLRVVCLWKQVSGYAASCMAALAAGGADVSVIHRAATPDAPYDDAALLDGLPARAWTDAPDGPVLLRHLESIRPHALLVVSWDVGAYRRVSRSLRLRTLRVLCMDNPWMRTAKQVAGVVVSPWLIRPTYDAVFLPGDRQAAFAHRLGFADDRILTGFYTCDYQRFAAARRAVEADPPVGFVFSGRLVEEKGVEALVAAYRQYRERVRDPWPLFVAGVGPLAGVLREIPGVEMHGFVQPDDLAALFARSACLVLPSRFEPWGVVVHEATAAGLAVICSQACGASERFVDDGGNGFVVPVDDVDALAAALERVTTASAEQRREMSRRSCELAAGLTPGRWAADLHDRVLEWRAALQLVEP